MRIFEIALPVNNNAGKSMNGAHLAFQSIVVAQAGGYTKRPTGEGVWNDDKTGQTHYDQMVPYQIACTSIQLEEIVTQAALLFPDQAAFWVACVGEAEIWRPNAPRRIPDRAMTLPARKFGQLTNLPREAGLCEASKAPATELEPFEVIRARALLEKAETRRLGLSAACWQVSEALRNWRNNTVPANRAALAASVAVSASMLDLFNL